MKIRLLILILFAALVVDIWVMLRLVMDNQVKTNQVVNTSQQQDPALNAPPYIYGQVTETITLTQEEEQISSLINQTPLTTDAFKISMDYAKDEFIVTITEPQEKNLPIFKKWLVDNNYTLIPQEKFKISPPVSEPIDK